MQDIMNWIPATNNMNSVKELERKIAVLERTNKALTDRLARTEHKGDYLSFGQITRINTVTVETNQGFPSLQYLPFSNGLCLSLL